MRSRNIFLNKRFGRFFREIWLFSPTLCSQICNYGVNHAAGDFVGLEEAFLSGPSETLESSSLSNQQNRLLVGSLMTVGAALLILVSRATQHKLFEMLEWLTVLSGVIGLIGIPDNVAFPYRVILTLGIGFYMKFAGHIRTLYDWYGLLTVEVLGWGYITQDPILLSSAGLLLVIYAGNRSSDSPQAITLPL